MLADESEETDVWLRIKMAITAEPKKARTLTDRRKIVTLI